MKVDLGKQSHILFFVVFMPAISFAAGWGFSHLFPNLPFWSEGLSPLGAYGLLYLLFERAAWHWPVFCWLGIVTAPDLRGRWVGEQLSSYKNAQGKPMESRVVLEVEQTFSGITTHTYYHRWNGTHAASNFLDIDGTQHLVIIFESEPGVHHDGDDGAHKGVVRLDYFADDGTLSGTYFNSNGRYGEMSLKRTSHQLAHKFTV